MTIHKIHLYHNVLDECVVFQFYPWYELYFPSFWVWLCMVMSLKQTAGRVQMVFRKGNLHSNLIFKL